MVNHCWGLIAEFPKVEQPGDLLEILTVDSLHKLRGRLRQVFFDHDVQIWRPEDEHIVRACQSRFESSEAFTCVENTKLVKQLEDLTKRIRGNPRERHKVLTSHNGTISVLHGYSNANELRKHLIGLAYHLTE
jgi:hypothetical protein